jgi:hypothetical protein
MGRQIFMEEDAAQDGLDWTIFDRKVDSDSPLRMVERLSALMIVKDHSEFKSYETDRRRAQAACPSTAPFCRRYGLGQV